MPNSLHRRSFLTQALLAAGGLAAGPSLLSACGGGGKGAANTVTVVSWGGVYQEAVAKIWWDPFAKATGIDVVQESPTDYAKLDAMVKTNNVTWDLVDVQSDYGLGQTTGSLTEMDCGVIPCSELQPDRFQTTGYRVPLFVYSNVLTYRTDKFDGRKPTSFADFFDAVAFPGKRAISSDASAAAVLEIALLADGVPANQLYPLDVDRALRKLDTIKPLLTYWETGAQSAQQLASGDATMGILWSSRAYAAEKEMAAPVAMMWDQHVMASEYLVVPKNAPNTANAMKLAAFMTSAENNALLSYHFPNAPANVKAFDKVNPEMEEHLPTSHLEGGVTMDDEYWAKNRSTVSQQFQTWRSS